MSQLNARVGGKCDRASTISGSQGCGLAAYMVATCFQDYTVLGSNGKGYDVKSDLKWKDEPRKAKADDLCKSTIHLQCRSIHPTDCISYLRGAILAHYDIVFMKKAKVGKMQAWEVNGSLENAFKKAPVTFLKQNGFVWYFCKCVSDPGSKADCMSMVTGKLRYI